VPNLWKAAGNDTYVVNASGDVVTENAGDGIDTVQSSITHSLGTNVEKLTLIGSSNINGTGNSVANTLIGNAGSNILDGGTGADIMQGGLGNDTYYVDNVGDQVIEAVSGGTDTVYTKINYALTEDQEIENLRADTAMGLTLAGNTRNDKIYGGAGDDILIGNDGNDSLTGGAGADRMEGGSGNDIYYVDSVNDLAIEATASGTDTLYTTINYELNEGQEIETLRANVATGLSLTGSSRNDKVYGGAGDDILVGNAGNDTLSGGAGADRMEGGAGNDIYYVDNVNDVVIEAAASGTDTIYTTINYQLDELQQIESLRVDGTVGLTLIGSTRNDKIYGGSGSDTLVGGLGNDTLTGNDGNDILNGEAGIDVMTGGLGDDVYYVDNASDQVVEVAAQGTDRVYVLTSLAYTVSDNVDLIEGSTVSAVNITGGSTGATIVSYGYNDSLTGGSGNDVLNGGQGNDTLTGGAGDDMFYFARGDGLDRVYASKRSGFDTVAFASGIGYDQLRFKRTSDDLEISVVGESQKITVANWYAAASNHAGQVVSGNGYTITDSGVEALVSAMASFSPPASGQTILTDPNTSALGTQLAANWQHA